MLGCRDGKSLGYAVESSDGESVGKACIGKADGASDGGESIFFSDGKADNVGVAVGLNGETMLG